VCRTKEEKAQRVGACDWASIGRIRRSLCIPVMANGGIASPEDLEECLSATGADAVMSSEMSLCSPDFVFRPVGSARMPVDQVVDRLLALAVEHELHNGYKPMRAHLFKLLFPALTMHPHVRERLGSSSSIQDMARFAQELAATGWEKTLLERDPEGWRTASWYYRHRPDRLVLDDTARHGEEEEGAVSEIPSAGRTLEKHQELLQLVDAELRDASAEYAAALEAECRVNKKDRNRLKRRMVKAENRKEKLQRKIGNFVSDAEKSKCKEEEQTAENGELGVAKDQKTGGADSKPTTEGAN